MTPTTPDSEGPSDAAIALLPCPFCSADVERDDQADYVHHSASESQSMGMGVSAGGFSSTTYAIQCECGIRVQGNNPELLVKRWNTRARELSAHGGDGGGVDYLGAALELDDVAKSVQTNYERIACERGSRLLKAIATQQASGKEK